MARIQPYASTSMPSFMFDIFFYPFMQRALIAGVILAAVLALLGVYVLLKRMSFFSDGIAHASLAGIALGIVFSWQPLTTALVLSAFFALIIYVIERKLELASDTAIGILFTSGMALGILLISLQPGYQPELISFLFGNILAIGQTELWLIGLFSVIIVGFVIVYFKQLTLIALDEELAYISNVKVNVLQPIFYVFLALAVVLGIKMLGVILVSALLILPTAAARILAPSFKKFIVLAVLLAEIIVLCGLTLSVMFDLPTGPVIVLVGTFCFIMSLLGKLLLYKK